MRILQSLLASLLMSLAIAGAMASETRQATQVEPGPQVAAATQPLRVMLVGNSLTYTNNLPRLLQALARSQPNGPRIETTSFVAPGGSLDERWSDGHAAAALRQGKWDALVLQESSGLPLCMANPEKRRQPRCRASERAHKRFAELTKAGGTPVLLVTTWGPDSRFQPGIDLGYDLLASVIGRTGAQIRVVPVAHALGTYADQHGWKQTLPDHLHPSLAASVIMAAQLYRAITGSNAQAHDLVIDFRMLPVNPALKPGEPLEEQVHLAGVDKRYLLQASALLPLLQVAYTPE